MENANVNETAREARFNPHSIFCNVNLEDPAAIRRLMIAFDYHFKRCVLSTFAAECSRLTSAEWFVVTNVVKGVKRNLEHPLLFEAVVLFAERQSGTDGDVLLAAKQLEELGTSYMLLTPEKKPREYNAALKKFTASRGRSASGDEDIRLRAPAIFYDQVYESHLGVGEAENLEMKTRRGFSHYVSSKNRPTREHSCASCAGQDSWWCSKEHPSCWNCLESGLDCVYPEDDIPMNYEDRKKAAKPKAGKKRKIAPEFDESVKYAVRQSKRLQQKQGLAGSDTKLNNIIHRIDVPQSAAKPSKPVDKSQTQAEKSPKMSSKAKGKRPKRYTDDGASIGGSSNSDLTEFSDEQFEDMTIDSAQPYNADAGELPDRNEEYEYEMHEEDGVE